MQKIYAGYKILTPISQGGLQEIMMLEQIARTCYKSEDLIKADGSSAKEMIRRLIKNGHEAMLEHMSMSVRFYVDRGVSHEEVRHRLCSFAQESTRYVNYSLGKNGSECRFIDIRNGMELDIRVRALPDSTKDEIYAEWEAAMEDANRHYLRMLELGATPQIARSVLPNSTKTEIVITTNYREWRAIFKLRADMPAHPQMREVMVPLLETFKSKIPIVFDDIQPYWSVTDVDKEDMVNKFNDIHDATKAAQELNDIHRNSIGGISYEYDAI